MGDLPLLNRLIIPALAGTSPRMADSRERERLFFAMRPVQRHSAFSSVRAVNCALDWQSDSPFYLQ